MRKMKMLMQAAIRPLVLTMVFCGTSVFTACSSKKISSFHENDYSFFYNNLKDNVAKRIATYMSLNKTYD